MPFDSFVGQRVSGERPSDRRRRREWDQTINREPRGENLSISAGPPEREGNTAPLLPISFEQHKERTMRLRIWMLWGVLASLLGLPGLGFAQANDAPSLAGVIDFTRTWRRRRSC